MPAYTLQKGAKMEVYTMDQWAHEFNADPGQEIEEVIYNKMLDGMPPLDIPAAFLDEARSQYRVDFIKGFLMGEPIASDNGGLLYAAFAKTESGKCYYLGQCPARVYETYGQMNDRHQREVNALPLKFAFGDKQLNEVLSDWGLTLEEAKAGAVYSMGGGGLYLAKDADLINGTFKRIQEEQDAAIAADIDGTGFIYEMFLTELSNHEYGYTGRAIDTILDLGLTEADIENSQALKNGLKMACDKINQYGDIY